MNCYVKKRMSPFSTAYIAGPNQCKGTTLQISRERDLREYIEKYFPLSAREEATRQRRLYSIEVKIKHMDRVSTASIAGPDQRKRTTVKVSREANLREYLEKYFSLSAREEAIRQRRLYSIEVEITKKCNLECPYCYSDSCHATKESLPPDVVRQLLIGGYEHGVRSVSWFGGEPLLYPYIFDVLEYAKDAGYRESILYTNGTRLSPEIARRLRGLVDTVAVHLDTLNSKAFQAIHHKKPAHQVAKLHADILRSFDALFEAGYTPDNIRLTLTLCRPVFETLEELFDWAFNRIGLQTSIFIPVALIGRGKEVPTNWSLTPDEVKFAYENRAQAEGRPYLLQLGISEYCKQYQMTMCYIRANGCVIPYAGSQVICGNVFRSSINEIIARNYEELAFLKYSDGDKNFALAGTCFDCQNQQYCFGNPVFSENSNHSTNSCCLW